MTVKFPIILKGYAIFNPETGLWSRGGTGNAWGKNPKIWSAIGHLKNHLLLSVHCRYPDRWNGLKKSQFFISSKYRGCQVIDVTTGNVVEDFDIYGYYYDYIAREKASHPYCADYDVYEEP
jgi:hypothetical protein